MDSSAKRQKVSGGYDWKLTPIPKNENKGKGKGSKPAQKGGFSSTNSNATSNVPPNKASSANAPGKGLIKGAPPAKSGKGSSADIKVAKEESTTEKNPSALTKFAPKCKSAPLGKSVSKAVPNSTHSSVGGKAGCAAPTLAKAKAKVAEAPSQGKGMGAGASASKGDGKGTSQATPAKGKGKGKGGAVARACRCGNHSAEEYWQALESKETYCSNCWEKVQARTPTNPTFGLLLGLEAMRDLGVQLPIAV